MTSLTSRPLVFIVGAGASKEFGKSMPVGSELASLIETQLSNEFSDDSSNGPVKRSLMLSGSGLASEDLAAGVRIRRSIFAKPSIDDLLHEWRDTPSMIRVGKASIANAILVAERNSGLGVTRTGDNDHTYSAISNLRDSWLGFLLRNLSPASSRRDIDAVFKHVAFIVFNYDRCIEQYLYWAIQSVAGINPTAAALALERIPIVHVYGSLGRLPFPPDDHPYAVPFGAEGDMYERVFSGIKTYTEEDHDQPNLERIHSLVGNAKRIVFLGLGYHERNISLLLSKRVLRSDCEIWGTSLNPEQSRLQATQRAFAEVLGRPPGARLESFACAQFLNVQRDALLSGLS